MKTTQEIPGRESKCGCSLEKSVYWNIRVVTTFTAET